MGVLYGFLIFVEIVVCALLIVVIFMQKSKGGMGGSAFGGGGAGEAIFGSRMGNVLTKSTVVMGLIFLVNTLLLTVLTTQRGVVGSVMEGAPRRPAQQQPAPSPEAGADDWMEMDVQPAGEVPPPTGVQAPTPSPDMGDDEVLQVPAAPETEAEMPMTPPEGDPSVDEEVEVPALPEEDLPDVGQ